VPSARLLKKLHKYWLGYGVIDASTTKYWRKMLFASRQGESFLIDKSHCKDLDDKTTKAIAKYDLSYRVAVVDGSETEAWLSEGGLVVFKFWAEAFPSVKAFSGNNPDVP
jgi:hypothetical protein